MFGSILETPADASPELRGLVDHAREVMGRPTWVSWRAAVSRVRDQLLGGNRALSPKYHPPLPGLNARQAQRVERARKHINLTEPAMDRLVNTIHSGLIHREWNREWKHSERLADVTGEHAYRQAMKGMCENAVAYGQGFLVPGLPANDEELGDWDAVDMALMDYWLPDPLWTIAWTHPVHKKWVRGLLELIPSEAGRASNVLQIIGARYITTRESGVISTGRSGTGREHVTETAREHNWGFLPLAMAWGRDWSHMNECEGRGLLGSAADATIRVTNNGLNLELLRDNQTQAILVIEGATNTTSREQEKALEKFVQFDKDGGTAHFIQPETRLADVIAVGNQFGIDASVSTGLPLDVFQPQLIAGVDASAQAARQRAFSLHQRTEDMVGGWVGVEIRALSVVAGLLEYEETGVPVSLRDLRSRLRPAVRITPSIPEAEAETLANWQQKTSNFLAPIEDAIEHYSKWKPGEVKEELAAAWRLKHDPRVENGDADELSKFKREIAKALYSGATTKEVMANLTNLTALVDAVGLPRFEEYVEPWLPVVAPAGDLVSPEVVKDGDGDVVGAGVMVRDESTDEHLTEGSKS